LARTCGKGGFLSPGRGCNGGGSRRFPSERVFLRRNCRGNRFGRAEVAIRIERPQFEDAAIDVLDAIHRKQNFGAQWFGRVASVGGQVADDSIQTLAKRNRQRRSTEFRGFVRDVDAST
jgi:hypothetical protein